MPDNLEKLLFDCENMEINSKNISIIPSIRSTSKFIVSKAEIKKYDCLVFYNVDSGYYYVSNSLSFKMPSNKKKKILRIKKLMAKIL